MSEAQIRKHLDQAAKLAYALVEKRARVALRGRNPAYSFCMGMGSASFQDKDGESLTFDYPYPRWAQPTMRLIDEFYDLKITGMPMLIKSPDAPTLKDW